MAADQASEARAARAAAGSIGSIVAWAGGSALRRAITLTLICILLAAPGLTALGPTDRDESRFAQATKQMLETGDFIDIRFQDAERHNKPVGIYWAQAAAASAFGGVDAPIWAYRIPSLLGAILASLLTMWAVRPLIGDRAAFLAGAMTASLLVLNVEAKIAKTDALLLASIVLAQGALARLWFRMKDDPRERAWNVFYLWSALAIGALLKGPIIFLPVLGSLAWLTITRSAPAGRVFQAWGRLGWTWGPVWLLLLAAPWFIAIGMRTQGDFFIASVGEDMLAKVGAGQEAHWGPPGYYLLAFWGTFWPWTALAPLALLWTWHWRRAPETAFLLGWIIPAWIVFELVSTKLPHYVLPTYPAICALIAASVLDGSAKPKGPLFWIGAVFWAIPAIALPVALAVGPPLLGGEFRWETAAAAGAALCVLVAAWRWLALGVWLGFVRAATIGAGLVYLAAFQFGFPATTPIWTSGRMDAAAAPYRACIEGAVGQSPLAAVGYHEPSLVFLEGRDLALLREAPAADWLAETPGGLVWVEERRRDAFETALRERGAASTPLATVEGFNYNRGKPAVMTLYARRGDPDADRCATVATRTQ